MSEHAQVASYALGLLNVAEMSRFEDHLADCDECASELEQLLPVADALAEVEPGEVFGVKGLSAFRSSTGSETSAPAADRRPSQPAQSAWSAQSAQSAWSAQSAQSAWSAQSARAAHPVASSQPVQPVEPRPDRFSGERERPPVADGPPTVKLRTQKLRDERRQAESQQSESRQAESRQAESRQANDLLADRPRNDRARSDRGYSDRARTDRPEIQSPAEIQRPPHRDAPAPFAREQPRARAYRPETPAFRPDRLEEPHRASTAGSRPVRRRGLLLASAAAIIGVAAGAGAATMSPWAAKSNSTAISPTSANRLTATDPKTGAQAEVVLDSKPWGTQVTFGLTSVTGPRKCQLVAQTNDGNTEVLSTWTVPKQGYSKSTDPQQLNLEAATALNRSDISSLSVQDVDKRGKAGATLVTVDT